MLYKKQRNWSKKIADLNEALLNYHENQGWYGYRKITLELRNRSNIINHKTVQKLMKKTSTQMYGSYQKISLL